MAPPRVTRRTSNQPTSSSQQQQQQQQQQLSFRTGGSAMKPSTSTTTSPTQDPKNKISKPLSAAARASLSSSAGTKARKSLLSKQVVTPQEAVNVVDVGIQPEPQVDSVIIQQQQQQQQQDGGEVKEEVKGEDAQTALAKKITQAQIVRYWSGREAQRMAPRVHQGGLAVREKVLREFDMSSRYGPSIGITRTQRWRRAHALRMAPPIEVLAVLVMEEKEGRGIKASRSIVDELMDSKVDG